MKLEDIALILDCSKPAASLLRAGKYERPGSDLLTRFERLKNMVDAAQAAAPALHELCRDCPRESCAGCRVADLL